MINNTDRKILEHVLLDVDAWLNNAKKTSHIEGKVESCFNRMKKDYNEVARDYAHLVRSKLVDKITTRDEYKNRVQREENNEK